MNKSDEIKVNNIGSNEKEVLNFLIEQGRINMDVTLNEMENMKKKTILDQHKYAISYNEKGGFYYTYLSDLDLNGKKIMKKRKNLADLENEIVSFYKSQQEIIYFETVWGQYINEKLEYGDIERASYDRYNNDFKRFFMNRPHNLTGKKFKLITYDDLERFIKTTIKELHLTKKAYDGLRTIIRGTFKYGKKHHYTDLSITQFFGDLELSHNLFTRQVIDKQKEVFMEDEIPLVTEYLRKNPTLLNLGILLTFETGLRVGELSTLKSSDLRGRILQIRRTEDKYRAENGKWIVTIKEHTKTDAETRDLIIPEKALDTISQILNLNPNGTYLFEKNGTRIRGNTFNKHLSIVCREVGIQKRTMHKIRKTYGTTLLDSDVNEKFIMEQMGHTDIATTKKYYYFSNKSEKTKLDQIEHAISF